MPEKSIIELKILDTVFNLKATENEDHILDVANYVKTELERVKTANPFTNHIRIAILGCMNITEKLLKAEAELENAEEQKIQEIGEINSVKEELKDAHDLIEAEKVKYATLEEEKQALDKEMAEKEELLTQYREHLRQSKADSEASRKTILDLQNQLFESQIELVKVNKNSIEKDAFKNIEEKIKFD
jgi:cell division protein ZapA